MSTNTLSLILAALMQIESRTPRDKNGDCWGALQITTPYLQDANRIWWLRYGEEDHWSNKDRLNVRKSKEMATTVLTYYAKPFWTPRHFALCHKKGNAGMHSPNGVDLDYAQRCENLVLEAQGKL